jgi:hypothetical protein
MNENLSNYAREELKKDYCNVQKLSKNFLNKCIHIKIETYL